MLQRLKSITKGSVVYGFGNMSIKLVGLILIPIYTNEKYLSISDFSTIGIIDITAQLLFSLLGLSFSQALMRWYWEKEYLNRQKSMFFSAFVTLLLINTVVAGLFYSMSGRISIFLFDTDTFGEALMLMMIASVLQILISFSQGLMKIQQKPVFFTVTNIIRLVITLVLTIVFVVYADKGVNGIYEAQILGSLTFLVMISGYIKKNIEVRYEAKIIREMLKYSYPLILAAVSGTLISILDKYILNFLKNPTDVSLYVFAYKFANSLRIFVIASVQMAVSPILFQIMHKPGCKRFYAKYMTYFSWIVMFFVVLLSNFSYEIIRLFASSEVYYESFSIVPILSFGFFFFMLKDTATTGLQITKKTGIISVVTIISTLLNVGLNYLLIPLYSSWGSASAFLLTQMVFFGLIYFYSQKHYPVPYELKKIFVLFLVGVILCSVTYFFYNLNGILRIALKMVCTLSFPFLLYLVGFYDDIEIQRIKEAWKKWKNPMHWKENLKHIKFDF